MGQYYKAVNIDKGEYVEGGAFDTGIKLMESCYVGNRLVNALSTLLSGPWHGDRVMYVGDYAWDTAIEGEYSCSGDTLLRSLSEDGTLAADPYQACREGGLRDAEFRLDMPRRTKVGLIDLGGGASRFYEDQVPAHDGLAIESLRYVINEDQGVFYDREACPVAWTWNDEEGQEHELRQDPLLIFLAVGNGLGGGDYRPEQAQELVGGWACQAITASNERPDGLREIANPFDPKA